MTDPAARSAQLLVLAKAPFPGRVKTRLCPPCTPRQAAELAAASLADTLDAVRGTGGVCRRVLALDGRTPAPAGTVVLPQRGDGLGERIAAAFADATGGACGPVLQLGMDTPQAGPDLLELCLSTLDSGVDAVLGPAEDGGWWALGLHRPITDAFSGVPMSTARAGAVQQQRLTALGLRTALLPALRDIDGVADLTAVAAQLPPSKRLARVVTDLGLLAA